MLVLQGNNLLLRSMSEPLAAALREKRVQSFPLRDLFERHRLCILSFSSGDLLLRPDGPCYLGGPNKKTKLEWRLRPWDDAHLTIPPAACPQSLPFCRVAGNDWCVRCHRSRACPEMALALTHSMLGRSPPYSVTILRRWNSK